MEVKQKKVGVRGVGAAAAICVTVACCGIVTAVTITAPSESNVKIVTPPASYFLSDSESTLLNSEVEKLSEAYNTKLSEDSQAVLDYLTKVSEDAAKQREQALRKAEQQKAFFDKQTMLQQALLEMNQQAMQGITSEGGDILYVDGVVVAPNEYYEQTMPNTEVTVTPEPTPVIDPKERGQFKARFVCTCSECFNPSQWPESTLAASTILADTKYLDAGSVVKIVELGEDTYSVLDGRSHVSGREVIVFHAKHNTSLDSKQMYIKIRDK